MFITLRLWLTPERNRVKRTLPITLPSQLSVTGSFEQRKATSDTAVLRYALSAR